MNPKVSLNRPLIAALVVLTMGVGPIGPALPGWANTLTEARSIQIAQATELAGSWRLVSMAGIEPGVPSPDVMLTADFAGDRLSGSGGCNRFMGPYQATGDQLEIGPLASTERACESFLMDQEFRYLTALQGAQRYDLSPNSLIIYYQNERESGELRFVPIAVRGLW